MGYTHLMQMLQVALNFEINSSKYLFVSTLQLTQLVHLSNLFSQQLMDLPLMSNFLLKGSYEECSRKSKLSCVTLLHMMPTMF